MRMILDLSQFAVALESLRFDLAIEFMARKGAILICGCGGSAADSAHMAAELLGNFRNKNRPGIAAIDLTAQTAFLTAWMNDRDQSDIFARQVQAYREIASCLVCISTSGNSTSVIQAARMARRYDIPVVALTGAGGGALAELADVLLTVASTETETIQPVHQMIYHHLCGEVEAALSAST